MKHYRSNIDGKPYYCRTCDKGFWEYVNCKSGDCNLENAQEARERQQEAVQRARGSVGSRAEKVAA